MTLVHHLRGYDKHTELLCVEYDIAEPLLSLIRELVTAPPDDPDLIQPYPLDQTQVVRLAERMGNVADPLAFDYFVEADEDWQSVAAQRDALRAVG
jgi:hypothetical protein